MQICCELCGAETDLTKHHLIPQVKHNKKLKKKLEKNKEDINETILICQVCHGTIHSLFSEAELRDRLNSLNLIQNNEKIKSYLEWRKNHINFKIKSTKLSNQRKKK